MLRPKEPIFWSQNLLLAHLSYRGSFSDVYIELTKRKSLPPSAFRCTLKKSSLQKCLTQASSMENYRSSENEYFHLICFLRNVSARNRFRRNRSAQHGYCPQNYPTNSSGPDNRHPTSDDGFPRNCQTRKRLPRICFVRDDFVNSRRRCRFRRNYSVRVRFLWICSAHNCSPEDRSGRECFLCRRSTQHRSQLYRLPENRSRLYRLSVSPLRRCRSELLLVYKIKNAIFITNVNVLRFKHNEKK